MTRKPSLPHHSGRHPTFRMPTNPRSDVPGLWTHTEESLERRVASSKGD